MNPATLDTGTPAKAGSKHAAPMVSEVPQFGQPLDVPSKWQKFPAAAMLLTIAFFGFLFLPPVRGHAPLQWTVVGVGSALLAWELLLWGLANRSGRLFRIEYYPIKAHYVQGIVQFTIFLYWGWYADMVYPEIPLIAAQLVFLYAVDAVLSWSRGRNWRLGFAPIPVVISTNLLLWFRHDWYYLQFLMLFTGALGKNFITWKRDGRQTHIFNPSAFGQFVFAIGLILTGTTDHFTLGREIATTFEVPHMLIVIFLVGLVVQFMFHVTLMTTAAVAALYLLNNLYYSITDTYYFLDINIAAPIFLGVHLLITDPATSPKTLSGRVIFGFLYGTGYFLLFRVLDLYGVPLFWDKLLPVPILNLCVPLIDRMVRSGWFGTFNRAWEAALPRPKLNLIHMGCWAAFFASMLFTGYIDAPHPANSIAYWKEKFVQGKHYAGESLAKIAFAHAQTVGSADAFNELGLIYQSGSVPPVKKSPAKAAENFAQACERGSIQGCANVVIQYLFLNERRSDADVQYALDQLEQQCESEGDWGVCFLVGNAYEQGRGRPWDKRRAMELYMRCGRGNAYGCKGLARIALSGTIFDLTPVVQTLEWSANQGDAESCWYLAYMHLAGNGVPQSEAQARAWLEKACSLGSTDACMALKQPKLPPFSKPVMVVPGWASALNFDLKPAK